MPSYDFRSDLYSDQIDSCVDIVRVRRIRASVLVSRLLNEFGNPWYTSADYVYHSLVENWALGLLGSRFSYFLDAEDHQPVRIDLLLLLCTGALIGLERFFFLSRYWKIMYFQ